MKIPEILLVETVQRPGSLASVLAVIADEQLVIEHLQSVRRDQGRTLWEITVEVDESANPQFYSRIDALPNARFVGKSDRVLNRHRGGKIRMHSTLQITTTQILRDVYTPGVARVCLAIRDDPAKANLYTNLPNTVAVVTNGTAVLGLGDIGPEAAMPVMEGKAMLFKELAGVDAFPIPLDTKDPGKIVETVKMIAPAFGGINLEDISAPRCFEIEERLRKELDIPVFHDDQHGTAVVVLAALLNALKIVKKDIRRIKVVVSGVGAAGTATIKILLALGTRNIIGVDEHGTIHRGRPVGMDFMKTWVASATNPGNVKGRMSDAIRGADVFIGLSVPRVLTVRDVKSMARDRIVFAMANPVPEIQPEEALRHVRVMATGRSDYPNQINNVLCFPGFFRGLLDSRARLVNDEMKIAAAHAIASCVARAELGPEYIIPSVFNKQVAPAVAREVAKAAQKTGVARRRRRAAAPDWF